MWKPWVMLVAVALVGAGCATKDEQAPPPPRIARAHSPTSLEQVVLRGTAEYGARITVTRTPAWTAPELSADPFTAEFELVAPLELGENTFAFTATDAAGNTSEPTTVTLQRVAFIPTALRLTVPLDPVSADRASAEVSAQLSTDEPVSLAGLDVTFTATHEDQATRVEGTAKTDGLGRAKTVLTGLTRAGRWTVKAAAAGVEDTALLDVAGGAPATAEVTLESTDDAGAPLSGTSITVSPAKAIKARVVIRDASPAANVLQVRWTLRTDAPGAFVAGDTLGGVVVAGVGYQAVAVVEGAVGAGGATVTGSASFSVVPGPITRLALQVSETQAVAGQALQLLPIATDQWGNSAAGALSAITVSPALAATFTPPGASAPLNQGLIGNQTFVAYDLSAVAGAGDAFTFSVNAPGTTPLLSAEARVEIRPAAAAGFKLVADPADPAAGQIPDFLFTNGCAATATRCTTASVAAGTDLGFEYQVVDSYGNDTVGPVAVVTNVPGAQVADDGTSGVGVISNLNVARTTSFDVTAYIAGVAGGLKRTLFVGSGPAADLALTLSGTLVPLKAEVKALAVVRDGFGNLLPCPAASPVPASVLEILSNPAAATASPLTCTGGLYLQTFTFGAEGTFALTATYQAGPVSAAAYVNVLGFDNTPPAVSVQNLRVNGTLCALTGAVPTCPCMPGDTVDFDLVANDNVSLSEVNYTAYFATAGTTGTTRARTVLVAANAPLPLTVPYRFSVPGNTQIEDVPLVGIAIDGAGNRSTSAQLILAVNLLTSGGRAVTLAATGGPLNNPVAVAFDAAGDLIIANDGGLLRVPAGTTTPSAWSSFTQAAFGLSFDGTDLFATAGSSIWRIEGATGATVTRYYNSGGGNLQGLTLVGATVAKGVINPSNAVDGAVVTVGATTFEVDFAGGCAGGRTCVTTTPGNLGPALATAILSAGEVDVVHNVTTNRLVVAAKAPGEAGNSLLLIGSATLTVTPGGTLREGHGQELFLGSASDNNVYRLPLNLGGLPGGPGDAHGTFNVGRGQRGVAIKDLVTASSANYRDLYAYVVDDNNSNTVRGYHFVDGGAGVQVFSTQGTGGINFNALHDAVLEPTRASPNPVNGCLLVSDRGNGRVYAIDVRDPTSSNPTVSLVAQGFSDPRGMAFHDGFLYVADRGFNAVVRIAPSASPTDCF